jgi:hypothetical protein
MMFNPFLNEFMVIPSSSVFNIFGWTSSVFTTEVESKRVDHDWRLAQLS